MSITIKGLGKLKPTIEMKIQKALAEWHNPSNLKLIAQFALSQIVKRTRLGKGVDRNEGEETPLMKLASSTINHRKRESLSSFTRASKSNLTETGEMLDAVNYTIDGKTITLDINNNTHSNSSVSNKRLAQIHQFEKGRPFFYFSSNDLRKIYDFVRTKIVKAILDKTK